MDNTPISLVSGTSLNRYSTSFESDLLVNALVVPAQTQSARSQAFLSPRLGKESVIDIANILGIWYSNSIKKTIVVTPTQIISISDLSDQKVLYTGTCETPLFEDSWDKTIVYIGTNKLFSIDQYENISQVSTNNLQGGNFSSLTFIDGYFLASIKNSRQFIRSELNGASFSDAINFQYLQSNDNIVNIAQLNRELYIFCERHTEVWWNTGASADSPFARQDGRIYPLGIQSKNSFHLNGALYNCCSADDNTCGFYSWTAGQYKKLSFDLLDQKITQANEIYVMGSIENNKTMLTVVLDGTEYWTYVLDSNMWFKRENWDAIDTFSINGVYYGCDSTGIFLIAGTKDRNQSITCTKTSQVFHSNEKRLFFKLLELDIGGDVHGIVRLSISDDGGKTWRNNGFASPSAVGEYNRVRFYRLGSSRSRIFKLTWTDTNIFNALLSLDEGSK